jgi:flagellar motor switch protein FliN
MSQGVDFEQLAGEATDGGRPAAEALADLTRLSGVPVDLSVEIGRTRMTVGETLALREGSVVTLDRMAGEPVDLLVNGTPIARGEVVVIDEQFGLRLTKVLSAASAAKAAEGPGPPVAELPPAPVIAAEDTVPSPVEEPAL